MRAAFEGVVFASLQLGNAGGVDIKTQHRALIAKFNGQRQAHVPKANDGDVFVVEVHAIQRFKKSPRGVGRRA